MRTSSKLYSKIATNFDQFAHFEYFLDTFANIAVQKRTDDVKIDRRVLNILLSYMYVTCDIGRKK